MKAYQLKVTINSLEPPVWRRVIVPAGITFSQLSVILNEAVGWSGYHLSSHDFRQLNLSFEEKDDWDDYGWGGMEIREASINVVDECLEAVKSYTYTYDFGDDWRHKVQIEKILEDYEFDYPKVIKWKGEAPYEDCGGAYGYYELLEELSDEKNPNHEDAREWVESCGHMAYDVDMVNSNLEKLFLEKKEGKPQRGNEIYEVMFKGKKGNGLHRINPDLYSEEDYGGDYEDDDLYDDPDEFHSEEEEYDDIDEMLVGAISYARYNDYLLLKKNTKMSVFEIKAALEIDSEEWEIFREYEKNN